MISSRQNTRTPTLPLEVSIKGTLKIPLSTDRAWIPLVTSCFKGMAPITGLPDPRGWPSRAFGMSFLMATKRVTITISTQFLPMTLKMDEGYLRLNPIPHTLHT